MHNRVAVSIHFTVHVCVCVCVCACVMEVRCSGGQDHSTGLLMRFHCNFQTSNFEQRTAEADTIDIAVPEV